MSCISVHRCPSRLLDGMCRGTCSMTSEWIKQPLTRAVARSIRSGTRVTRPIMEGHRFDFTDLKEVWSTEDRHHVVLTHHKDPVWQYWCFDDERWQLRGWATTKEVAQAAGNVDAFPEETSEPAEKGIYVVATKEGRTLRTRCFSQDGPPALAGIYKRMGYDVKVHEVS